jgi:hypothetical protein
MGVSRTMKKNRNRKEQDDLSMDLAQCQKEGMRRKEADILDSKVLEITVESVETSAVGFGRAVGMMDAVRRSSGSMVWVIMDDDGLGSEELEEGGVIRVVVRLPEVVIDDVNEEPGVHDLVKEASAFRGDVVVQLGPLVAQLKRLVLPRNEADQLHVTAFGPARVLFVTRSPVFVTA